MSYNFNNISKDERFNVYDELWTQDNLISTMNRLIREQRQTLIECNKGHFILKDVDEIFGKDKYGSTCLNERALWSSPETIVRRIVIPLYSLRNMGIIDMLMKMDIQTDKWRDYSVTLLRTMFGCFSTYTPGKRDIMTTHYIAEEIIFMLEILYACGFHADEGFSNNTYHLNFTYGLHNDNAYNDDNKAALKTFFEWAVKNPKITKHYKFQQMDYTILLSHVCNEPTKLPTYYHDMAIVSEYAKMWLKYYNGEDVSFD